MLQGTRVSWVFRFALVMVAGSAAAAQEGEHDVGILAPFTVSSADLVGEYWCGDSGMSQCLRLDADGSFDWALHGCLGVEGRNHGTFNVVDSVLQLEPAERNVVLLGGTRFVPVKWGDRLYLIPAAIIGRFRERIARGEEPRIGIGGGRSPFYLRASDWDVAITSVPIAPAPWNAHFQLLKPAKVQARVTALRSEPYKELVNHYAVLDRGAKDGLRQHMWLTLQPSSGEGEGARNPTLLVISQVNENSAECRVIVGGDVLAGTPHGIKVGDVASVAFCVAEPEHAPQLSPQELRAKEEGRRLLEDVARRYATCASYADDGLVTTLIIDEHGEERRLDAMRFSTRFVRPGRYRFEFGNQVNGAYWCQGVIWRDGEEVLEWDRLGRSVPTSSGHLSAAIAGATGVSSGAAHTIPRLLLPDDVGGFGIDDVVEAKLTGEEEVGRVTCWKVTGRHPSAGCAYVIWIDKTQRLIRGIEVVTQEAAYTSRQTTSYHPRIDTEIADDDLVFDPPA